jgi:hypothetical protein
MRNPIQLAAIAILGVLSAGSAFAGTPVPIDVPEPASMALLAGGIGALAFAKFRRRK